jgi:hypothetical protein
MPKPAKEVVKKFVQVSLSNEFAAGVRAQAQASDRSMAAQLEHWAKVARAVEAVIPAAALGELKSGNDAGEILSRVGTYLLHQNPGSLRARLATAQSPRYGVDENDPEIALRINPDGTQTRGSFDAAGSFVPLPSAKKRMDANVSRPVRKTTARKEPERRAAARSRPSKGRPGNPVAS